MTLAICIGCNRNDNAFEPAEHWLRISLPRERGVCSRCLPYIAAWDVAHAFGPAHFDLVGHLYRQREFSRRTFGPDARTKGVLDHIRKELVEIEAAPGDIDEWADLILLSLDGAWRAGHEPADIALSIATKLVRNELRDWPDWRTADPTKAIEHVRAP